MLRIAAALAHLLGNISRFAEGSRHGHGRHARAFGDVAHPRAVDPRHLAVTGEHRLQSRDAHLDRFLHHVIKSRGLEWQTSSPPSAGNFDKVPVVLSGPYDYGVKDAPPVADLNPPPGVLTAAVNQAASVRAEA